MLSLASIITAVAGVLFLLVISYITGFCLQRLANQLRDNQAKLNSFWRLFCGFFFLISCYAILNTKGITILLPVPLLIALLTWTKTSDEFTERPTPYTQDIKFVLLTTLFHFFFYGIAFYPFNDSSLIYISGDFNIYLRMAEYLNRTGIENNMLDPTFADKVAVPYHYGDLWLYSFVAKFPGANPSVIFLISFTVLSTLTVYGIRTYIYEKLLNKLDAMHPPLYLLILCGLFTGFSIFFPSFVLKSDIYVFSILNYPKILLPSFIFIGMIILAMNKEWTSLVLAGMIGGFSFINVLPPVYLAISILLLVNLLKGNIKVQTTLGLGALLLLFTAGYFFLFYKVFSGDHTSLKTPSTGGAFNIAAYFKTSINIFIGGSFQLFTIMPYIIVLLIGMVLLYKRKVWQAVTRISNDIILIALLFFCGLASWAVLYPVSSDSVQFFHNGLFTLYAIIISLILIWVVAIVRNRVLTTFAVVLILISVWTNKDYTFSIDEFHKADWDSMEDFFKRDVEAPGFVNIQPEAYFVNIFNRNTNGYIPLNVLNYRWPDYYNLSLNAPFIHSEGGSPYYEVEKKMLESAPFTRFVKGKASHNKEYLVKSFLKQFDIKYVTVGKDTILPVYLRPYVLDTLNLKQSGFTIYKISAKQ